jgi:hypothetical protein
LFEADGDEEPYDDSYDVYEKFSPTGSGMGGMVDINHRAS